MTRDRVLAAEEGLPPVIMFAFDDYFPAVAATDLLVRTALRNGLDVSPASVVGAPQNRCPACGAAHPSGPCRRDCIYCIMG